MPSSARIQVTNPNVVSITPRTAIVKYVIDCFSKGKKAVVIGDLVEPMYTDLNPKDRPPLEHIVYLHDSLRPDLNRMYTGYILDVIETIQKAFREKKYTKLRIWFDCQGGGALLEDNTIPHIKTITVTYYEDITDIDPFVTLSIVTEALGIPPEQAFESNENLALP